MMNDDYLWDKTGEDAEIERLENRLRAFRYRQTAPPALPSNAPFQKAPKSYRNVYAAAACVAFAMILLGAWLPSAIKPKTAQMDSAKITMPENELLNQNDLMVPNSPAATREKIAAKTATQRFPTEKIVKHKKIAIPIPSSDKLMAGPQKPLKQPVVTLTKVEKYAYDQLMLALSITSSRLKMVKDKAAGLEDSTARDEGQR